MLRHIDTIPETQRLLPVPAWKKEAVITDRVMKLYAHMKKNRHNVDEGVVPGVRVKKVRG